MATKKMEILIHPLRILQCLGLWRPEHWKSSWKAKLYNLYTCFVVFFITSITVSELIALFLSTDDIEVFANTSFIALTMIGICGKTFNVIIKRKELLGVIETLREAPCHPRTDEEFSIHEYFNHVTKLNTLGYGALTGFGASSVLVRSFQNIAKHEVTYDAWVPYDDKSPLGSCLLNLHQIFAHTMGAGINVAFDTLVPGVMLLTCGQLNILKLRFQKIPEQISSPQARDKENPDSGVNSTETEMLADCVEHHLLIFKLAKTLNNIFNSMIFVQYSLSTIVLCVSVLELTHMQPTSVEGAGVLMYLACMLLQIFIYCLYGDQVTNESLAVGDAVFGSDWPLLSVKTKRTLITIMARTLRPIIFTSGHVVTLNLESFNSLLKLSYSTYNVLQKSPDQ
ncbi:odorant receptor 2a-like [Venturia canescens]|uniref:odorant receptor 2a-like n=1 Tax=Venturia canescens TaxID=32260 RepID=UPI001C9CA88C|nr:odorant receptor 2a-like [Venturia canescens]